MATGYAVFHPPTKPWEQCPYPDVGDTDHTMLLQAIGYALSEWNRFEAHLAVLFGTFVALDSGSQAAVRAFGAVRTFEARKEMIKAAGEVYFSYFPSNTLKTKFNKLAGGQWRDFSSRRNEIAHGVCGHYITHWKTGFSIPDGGYALAPAYYDFQKTDLNSRPDYCYNSGALAYYGERFAELTKFPLYLATHIFKRGRSSQGIDVSPPADEIP